MSDAADPRVSRRQSALGVGASSLAAVGWGFAGVFASLTSVSGVVLTFYRTWIGTALLTAALYVGGRRMSVHVIRVSAVGGLLLAADMSLFFSSVKLTSVAVTTVIGALQPALVMLMAGRLLGERVDRLNIVWTAVAIVGVAIIVLGGGTPDHHERLGDLLAVGSLLAWAGYFVAAKRAQPRIDALDYTAGVTLVAAAATSVVVLVSRASFGVEHGRDWLWICLLAVVPTGAHLMMNWAHRYLDASISSVIGSANPIVAAIAAYFVLGQGLDPLQIAGGSIGIVAISVVAARRRHVPTSPVE